MIYVAGLIAFIPLLAGEILALASRKERAAIRPVGAKSQHPSDEILVID